jgi:GDP-mannose transporter
MADDKKTDEKMDQSSRFEPTPPSRRPSSSAPSALSNNAALPVLAYCGSSIMMTVMNKYVLSGLDFNLNFFLLLVQVCSNPSLFGSGSFRC